MVTLLRVNLMTGFLDTKYIDLVLIFREGTNSNIDRFTGIIHHEYQLSSFIG